MRRYAPLLAHTLRRPCGGRRPESDPAGGGSRNTGITVIISYMKSQCDGMVHHQRIL